MSNMGITGNAAVTRVIIEGGRAVGIEVSESVPSWRGVRTRVRKLFPKLLMLSGIGPRKHLEENGVPLVLGMPHVVTNLHDHFIIPTTKFSKLPMEEADRNVDGLHGQVYFSCELPAPPFLSGISSPRRKDGDHGGIGDNTGTETTSNTHPSAVVGLVYSEISDGGGLFAESAFHCGTAADSAGSLGRFPPRPLLAVTTIQSRNTVCLASVDAAAPPLIDPAYMPHPQNQRAACEVWRTVRRAKRETPTGMAVFGSDLLPGKSYGNDDKIFLRCARDNCLLFFRPVGTCRMGKGAEDSVVYADSLRVHGVSGLRVADASVAPRLPSTPTQAMARMIGDRAASLALNDRAAKQQVQA
eukprot:jgi/Undpi1/8943/HiC_scaffold_26.g11404.m1